MNSQEDILSFMDFLDLNESLIDERLKSLMIKEKYSNKHLGNAIQLLQYKHLINVQDDCDCENEEECDFAAKLISQVTEENIENVCKIVASTLSLNTETMLNKSEHLLQQLLSDIDLPNAVKDSGSPEPNSALLVFKIADSILEALIKKGAKVTLPFLELPVKQILLSADEQLKIHFLTSFVPKLFQGVVGYNILDKVWDVIKQLEDDKRDVTMKVLSSLSEYYLPVPDCKGKVLFESEIVYHYEFWHNIVYGLSSPDASLRKISIYLAKRALDCILAINKNICVKTGDETIFTWNHSRRATEKTIWDNFFILIDSLEEKQSNIVIPSLKLFGSVKVLGHWLNCAFNIGLKHDNTQVRLKCLQYRLETKIKSKQEAIVLLEAFNDINIYDNPFECVELKQRLGEFISDKAVFVHILSSIPLIKWSPVPLFHLTSIISEVGFQEFDLISGQYMTKLLMDILKVTCNNVAVRKAVFVNISHLITNCYSSLHWKDYISLCSVIQAELKDSDLEGPLSSLISRIYIEDKEKVEFFQSLEHVQIEVCLLYIQHNPGDIALFIDELFTRMKKVNDIVARQYSDRTECLKDVIFLTQLYKNSGVFTENVKILVAKEYKTIIYYLLSLLSNNTVLSIEEINSLSNGFSTMSCSINSLEAKEDLLQLYKTSVLFIKDKDTILESKLLSLFLIHVLSSNPILLANYKHEMIGIKDIITLTSTFENTSSIGRLRNTFYEKSCEIIDSFLNDQECNLDRYAKDIAEYIENVIECGGYGCLRWCLKIMNTILPYLLCDENNKLDVAQFITRMWKEIEELKSNNQYNPCMEEFVNLITQEELLKRSMYNNVINVYCNKIIEYGALKTAPLFYLIQKLNSIEITSDYGQIIYILSEVLLYSPVPRKDQRIMENLVVEILQHPKYGFQKQNVDIHFNYQIQYLAVLTLCKIKDTEILQNIAIFIRKRVDDAFKNKQRYHGHSQAHRLLLTALQHLLLISALRSSTNDENDIEWYVQLLGNLPHQPSVRICLEWYIALQLCLKKTKLNEDIHETLKNIPLISQFMILFWTVKHKIQSQQCADGEYDFVMDFFLSHTMGQMFNIRLHAQYLAVILHSIYKSDSVKYAYTIQVIERTFIESAKDKNYVKLQQDYFVNKFDIVNDFTPSFIYYFIPRYCEINSNENVDLTYVKDIIKHINKYILSCDFFKTNYIKSDEEVFRLSIAKNTYDKGEDDVEMSGTIQKKYIPWKNMSDVNMYESGKKKAKLGHLIVVASLIDKLPNLGGMARTGEVFGVETYVVDSLRHLQDKQFQGLSVSAERWIDVEEVRPGAALKAYVARQKAAGYCAVAAEQTSSSTPLQTFRFPKKTLLLLGHEKEGIPCDLLPLMDHCVEIPQQGFVRSLNVHVTAAIFIWEYTRQNIL